jgi:hypothetical protein
MKHQEEIYKIGRTNDFNRRINKYLIETKIISSCPIDNKNKCESELIREFKSEFEFENNISNEYIEGNGRDMISVFNDYCSDHFQIKMKRSEWIIISKLKIKD